MEGEKAHMHDLKEESNASSDNETNKSSKPDKISFVNMSKRKACDTRRFSGSPKRIKEDTHEFHSFEYRFSKQKKYGASCSQYGTTVLESLQKQDMFNKNMGKKVKDKEIVIEKERKAICTHFPCCLLSEGELINIEFIKPIVEQKRKQKAKVDSHNPSIGMLPGKLLTFSVNTTGGDNIKREVMRNPALRNAYEQVIVYAYEGERLKDALRRDGRFKESLFIKHCVLYDPITETTFEMSHPVDEFDGKMFKVELIDRSTVEDSQPSSQEEDVPLTTCTSDADRSKVMEESPHQNPKSTSYHESATPGMSAQEAALTRSKKMLHEIPDSGEVYKRLCSQFKDLVEVMKERTTSKSYLQVQQLFTEEYGKSVETCLEMRRVRELTVHGESVCQVRVKGSAVGSGFLLFDRFILTNGHVIKDVFWQNKLQETVTVTFDFEDLSIRSLSDEVAVSDQVVAIKYEKDASGNLYDMALLELCPGPGTHLPPGLLKNFAFPPQQGGICIIGHPGQGVKKIDPCCIISTEDRKAAVETKHYTENKEFMHLMTKESFKKNWDLEEVINRDHQRITYDTCFYHGSSGSPVFDEHCNVIAMHSGGYAYKTPKGKTQSVIEYALPLSVTLEIIIRNAVLKERADVLQSFLAGMSRQCYQVLQYLKCKIDKEKPKEFFKSLETHEGQNLTYYDFLFDREEPMDLDEHGEGTQNQN